MKNTMMKIFKNEKVQTVALAMGVFGMMLLIFAGMLYSFDKTTTDPFQEKIAEENARLAAIRAASFETVIYEKE